MFSSLPSASKLYASGVSRGKPRGTSAIVRKKRKRTKIVENSECFEKPPDTTPTLIEAAKDSANGSEVDYESDDATESVSGSIVRFSTVENVVPCDLYVEEEPLIKLDHITENENVIAETLPSNKSGNSPEKNVIITSAEVHHDSSKPEQDDVSLNDTESSDEELRFNKPFNQTPVIIISSTDSPCNETEFSTDCSSHVDCDSSVVEVEESRPEFTGSKHVFETVKEESESDIKIEEAVENNQANSENNSATEFANDPPHNTFGLLQNSFEVLESNSTLTVPDPASSEKSGNDSVSVKSDCCSSKNIYNEYSTESTDETEDMFMVDDSKQGTSSSDCATSPSESDENENSRLLSPDNGEGSGTESCLDHLKKSMENVNADGRKIITADLSCQTSVKDFAESSVSVNSFSNVTPKLPRKLLPRTMSLPDYSGLIYEDCSSVNQPNIEPSKKFTSDFSFAKPLEGLRSQKDGEFSPSVSVDVVEYSCGRLAESCQSSKTNLSTSSSSFSSVLPPVAVKEARLRSFVVGSVRAAGSLLGVEELSRYFPDKRVKVFVGTWNMNEQNPPECIDDFLLPLGVPYLPDIYAVGVQEGSQSRSEWEILMQTTIGPSHVLLMSTSLGVLHLAIFIRRDLIWFCSEPEDAHVTTRPGTMVKTKGAVAISFMFFGTSFLFINSHLTAHERKLKERLADYEKICCMIDLPRKILLKPQYQSKDATSRFDNVFWCGDLNFRVVRDRPSVLNFVEEKLRQTVSTCEPLLRHDQLHKAMNEGVAFHGFQEGIINFVPSYKFDIGTCFFNSTKQRVPSYTDRVLYRSKKKDSICCTHYNVVSDIMTSDHKPVYAVFEVDIRAGRDNIPLAAGLFRREVYLEANRRRATALEVTGSQKNSTICSIM